MCSLLSATRALFTRHCTLPPAFEWSRSELKGEEARRGEAQRRARGYRYDRPSRPPPARRPAERQCTL